MAPPTLRLCVDAAAPHARHPLPDGSGWRRVTLIGASVAHPFWPTLQWRDAHARAQTRRLPFVDRSPAQAAIHLPADAHQITLQLTPWRLPLAHAAQIIIQPLPAPQRLARRLCAALAPLARRSVWRMLRSVAAQGINARGALPAAWRILHHEGAAGLTRRLTKPLGRTAADDAIPDFWWLQRYLAAIDPTPTPAADAALADYLILRRAGAELTPDARAQLAHGARESGAELICGDLFVRSGPKSGQLALRGRFCLERFLSAPELGGVVAVRRDIAARAGVVATTVADAETPLTLAALLRLLPLCQRIAHVSALLCLAPPAPPPSAAELQSLRALLATRWPQAAPEPDRQSAPPGIVWRWPAPQEARVAIIIPTRDNVAHLRRCVESIARSCDPARYRLIILDHASRAPATRAYLAELAAHHSVQRVTGPFNFARFNNLAAELADPACDFLLFLNDDVEALNGDWLTRLTGLAARADVGAVGPLLQYPDGRAQHAGLVLGLWRHCDHVGKFQPVRGPDGARNPGRDGHLTHCAQVSALTGACLLMRRRVFEEVGGFDEQLAVGYNDVDLCLRVGDAGYAIVYDGHTVMTHHESATRGKSLGDPHPQDTRHFLHKHGARLRRNPPDLFFSPLLSRDHLTPTPEPERAAPPAAALVQTAPIWPHPPRSPQP
ncbi:glycosyltransferase family 2 protein [Magnetofaba australis]|uniref:glycosyltransferase family 2 protein n=1 Tax=Magnetofaba australis TaxID=1472297 RepID=UPI001301D98F|nr:glycosyltransferase family 2 protein [Magnetofaba australis]